MTPSPQLLQNKPLMEQPKTIDGTKRSQAIVETKSCTVRLEILSEANIVKHVHVHRETEPHKKTPPTVETVETSQATHFTRSCAKPKPDRITRHPRTANQHIDYSNLETAEEDSQSPTSKCQWFGRPQREPSNSWIKSDSFTTKQPVVRPLHRSSRLTSSLAASEPISAAATSPTKPVPKLPTPSTSKDGASQGTFKTQSYGLKKSKKVRKFGCQMCDVVCASTKELIKHHQCKHNILYCDVCSKAFNNPSSLVGHQYSDKELRFKCDDCDQHFAFESNLQTHRISHRTLLSHCCVYPNCNKKFKNKGDLTRHAKEHDGIMHKCPDCSYKNPDV